MIDRAKLRGLFEATPLGVISSINGDGHPESAVVGITFLEGTFEVVVGTSDQSRKYRNMTINPAVSLAMWHEKETVQIEGLAKILEHNTPEYAAYTDKIIQIHPFKLKHANNADQVWIIVRPTWMRYTDIGSSPWKIEEEAFK